MSIVVIMPMIISFEGTALSTYTSSDSVTGIQAKLTIGNTTNNDRKNYLIFTISDIVSMLILFISGYIGVISIKLPLKICKKIIRLWILSDMLSLLKISLMNSPVLRLFKWNLELILILCTKELFKLKLCIIIMGILVSFWIMMIKLKRFKRNIRFWNRLMAILITWLSWKKN